MLKIHSNHFPIEDEKLDALSILRKEDLGSFSLQRALEADTLQEI